MEKFPGEQKRIGYNPRRERLREWKRERVEERESGRERERERERGRKAREESLISIRLVG